jgi:hypothetical protein
VTVLTPGGDELCGRVDHSLRRCYDRRWRQVEFRFSIKKPMTTVEYPNAVICVHNEGNEVSLQLWKIYKPLRDHDAKSEGFLRIVDESGEDYLFPEENFVPIELPNAVKTEC